MRPVRRVLSAAGADVPIPLDRRVPPVNVRLQLIFSAGAVLTCSVQYTTDDVQTASYVAGSGNWFDVPGLSAQQGSASTTLPGPATAVRANVTNYTSGTVELDVLQSGP